MQKNLASLILLSMLTLSGQLFADLPGGMNQFAATIRVYNHEGNPYAGIPLQLYVQTTGPWGSDICVKTGTTDAGGWCYLECLVEPEYSEQLDWIEVTITNSYYAIVESENTSSSSSSFIFPVFDIGVDNNLNDIFDAWEMPLAQKFCPYLVLHSEDNGVRPVPVESMDRNGDDELGWEDLLVTVISTGEVYIGEFELDELYLNNLDGTGSGFYLYELYPQLAPVHLVFGLIDLDHNGSFDDGGEQFYFVLPHFEWGSVQNTSPSSWYSSWSSFIGAHSSESSYVDGTTYANFFREGDDTIIQFWFYYPFNVSANRHEGDWEHINVVLDSQDPDIANISRVEFYSHNRVTVRTNPSADYVLTGGTHPKIFVGGHTESIGLDGHGTHASYPFAGQWENINILNILVVDETVDGSGLHIDFANYQNVVLLPSVESLQPGGTNDWLLFGGFWGYIESFPSAGENIEFLSIAAPLFGAIPWANPWPLILSSIVTAVEVALFSNEQLENSNAAPLGPATKKSWEAIYTNTGATVF